MPGWAPQESGTVILPIIEHDTKGIPAIMISRRCIGILLNTSSKLLYSNSSALINNICLESISLANLRFVKGKRVNLFSLLNN